MAQYIDKNTLVEEIERRRKLVSDPILSGDDLMIGERNALFNLLSFIDTLEVKKPDLDKALSDLDKNIKEFVITEEFERESETCGHYWTIAKHAFLFGLNKAQEGIN